MLKELNHLLIAALALIFGHLSSAADTNVSLNAMSASASVNTETASRIMDNNRGTFWCSFQGESHFGEEAYVELQWYSKTRVNTIRMVWAVSGDSVALPSQAWLSYWDDDNQAWVKAADLTAGSASTSDEVNSFLTHRIRIYMKGAKACGIKEARVFGETNADPAEAYVWPDYSSELDYNYRRDYPNGVPAPTKFLPEDNGQVGITTKGWWAFAWGKNRNHYVTDEAIDGLLDKMNTDFGYFRDSLGWLPDKRARNGYYSTVYLFGSGLNSDTADSTALGGWQSATTYNGESWPMVYLSYYPVACFDKDFTYDEFQDQQVTDATAQQNACVHEGIHAVFADLEGCKNAAWFQESGNTSMQADAELSKTPTATPQSMGFLSAGTMVAPFMPIECYSGWLLDGSFGGPSAEGVNNYNASGQQICTWRNLLGGVQYSEMFAHFLSVRFSQNTLPWIWRYCRDRVLSGIADTLGEVQTRRLVREFRVKQATLDFSKWTKAARKLLDDNWLLSVKQEWSPYLNEVEEWKATPYNYMYADNNIDSAGWWKPELRTCPGWSGANQIPLHVSGTVGDTIRIHFKPLADNMECQFAYRSKRGRIYYSQPSSGEGDVAMVLKEAPANNVVIAVVVNTDYIYTGETQRKSHYDYRLKMLDNVYQPASPNYKWYNYGSFIKDATFNEDSVKALGISDIEVPVEKTTSFGLTVDKNVVQAGGELNLHFTGVGSWMLQVRLHNAAGQTVYAESFLKDGVFHVPSSLAKGIYILEASDHGQRASVKIVVE